MAAAAVECEVNWTISKPLLFIKQKGIQRYANNLALQFVRTNIQAKIGFLKKANPDFALQNGDKPSLKRLFELRNSYVHSSLELNEPYYVPEDYFEREGLFELQDLPTATVLQDRMLLTDPYEVACLLEAGERFINMLQALKLIGSESERD